MRFNDNDERIIVDRDRTIYYQSKERYCKHRNCKFNYRDYCQSDVPRPCIEEQKKWFEENL